MLFRSHLALSILVKSGGGERLIRRIQSENIRSYFRSLLSLTERNNDTYISHVKTIFDVVGYRNGARHHTLLYRQLDDQKKTTAEITTTILALFDQVLIGLSSLKKFTSGLPNTCNYNWLKEKIESIESLIEQKSAESCHNYLYSPKQDSFFIDLKKTFCFQSYALRKYLESRLAKHVDILDFRCAAGVDYDKIDDMFSITSNHFEELVFELITNALKY